MFTEFVIKVTLENRLNFYDFQKQIVGIGKKPQSDFILCVCCKIIQSFVQNIYNESSFIRFMNI